MFQREYRDLAFVPRWSIIRTIKNQSVAEHSFFVALYAEQFARLIEWGGNYGTLLKYALHHDMDESFTGDMPGPAKRKAHDKKKYDEFIDKELTDRFWDTHPIVVGIEEVSIVKIADGLDEMLFLASEIQLGNRAVEDLFQVVCARYREITVKILIDVFKQKPDDAAILWRLHIEPAIQNNRFDSSEILK